jgi:hypothetical protein
MAYVDKTAILKNINFLSIKINNRNESNGFLRLTRVNSEKKYIVELTCLNSGLDLKVKNDYLAFN